MSAQPDIAEMQRRLDAHSRERIDVGRRVGELESRLVEMVERLGRVEAGMGEVRAELDQLGGQLSGISEALTAVRAAGDERARVAAEQSGRILDLLGQSIGARAATDAAQIEANKATRGALIQQAAQILAAVGGLAGAAAAAWAALR